MSRLQQLIQSQQDLLWPTHSALAPNAHLAKLGPSPTLKDQESLRHWLTGLLPVLDVITEAVPSSIDDHIATLIRIAIEDDQAWEALYGLLSLVSGGRVAAAREANMALVASEKTGFDVDTIMEIVRLILQIIDQLQQ